MRIVVVAGLLFLALGCSSPDTAGRDQDPKSARARDSVLGASSLPGAEGVQRALEVADSAAARKALLDSLAQEP
jgi:hypothetical protein